MPWKSLPVVFIYATHKENKSDKQDTVFHNKYKEDIVYLFYPTLQKKKIIKHNLKALLFINSTFQLTLDDSQTPKKQPYKKLQFIYESGMFNVHSFEILRFWSAREEARPQGLMGWDRVMSQH